MKKFLLLLAFSVVLGACQKDNNEGMNRNTVMYVNSSATPKATKADPELLSPLEIVKQAIIMDWHNSGVGIGDWNKDLANVRFMFLNVINPETGGLEPALIEARDLVFIANKTGLTADRDTIAYIPNSVMEAGDNAIKVAYAAGEYEKCEQLFKELFNFIPITGAQWRELKAKGEN